MRPPDSGKFNRTGIGVARDVGRRFDRRVGRPQDTPQGRETVCATKTSALPRIGSSTPFDAHAICHVLLPFEPRLLFQCEYDFRNRVGGPKVAALGGSRSPGLDRELRARLRDVNRPNSGGYLGKAWTRPGPRL